MAAAAASIASPSAHDEKKTASSSNPKAAATTAIATATASDSKVDTDLVRKALTALIRHHSSSSNTNAKKEKTNLLGTDTKVQVLLSLEVAPKRALVKKPIRLPIPHSFRRVVPVSEERDSEAAAAPQPSNILDDLEEAEVCLIVKDDSKPWVQEMIRQFPEHMGCIKKVLGLQSLRTKHAQYQQRRELLRKYTIFFADDRIVPMLPEALGCEFIKYKKQPIPINLTRKRTLPFALQKALRSTFMTIPKGTCITVVAGTTNMSLDHLVENVVAVAHRAPEQVPRKWANVRSMLIKTPESAALPFYNRTPQQLHELAELAGIQPVWKPTIEATKKRSKDDEEDDNDDEDENDAAKKRKQKLKSPLLRALKKQKSEAKEVDHGKDGEEHNSSKKSRKGGEKNPAKAKHDGEGDEESKSNRVTDDEGGKADKKRKVSDASSSLDGGVADEDKMSKKRAKSDSKHSNSKPSIEARPEDDKKKKKSKIKTEKVVVAVDEVVMETDVKVVAVEKTSNSDLVAKSQKKSKGKSKETSRNGLDKIGREAALKEHKDEDKKLVKSEEHGESISMERKKENQMKRLSEVSDSATGIVQAKAENDKSNKKGKTDNSSKSSSERKKRPSKLSEDSPAAEIVNAKTEMVNTTTENDMSNKKTKIVNATTENDKSNKKTEIMNVKTENDKSSKKGKKDNLSKSSSAGTKVEGGEDQAFIQAKQFSGSKKGYVFKRGSNGTGYYTDVKPVVDTMAVEALLRTSKEKSSRKSGKEKKHRSHRR